MIFGWCWCCCEDSRSRLARDYTDIEISDTFWHEVTHAILDDMNHELCLDGAILSVRFQKT